MATPSLAVRFAAEPLRSSAFGAVTGSYTAIGTPFEHPIRIIFIQNLSDETLLFSFDGVNDAFRLTGNGFLLLDIMANHGTPSNWNIAQGSSVYVKNDGVAPTTGSADVAAFYGSGT